MLAFGAGANYALLLLISRYREELHEHDDHRAALATAWRATVPAILASNATVVLPLATLLLASVPATERLNDLRGDHRPRHRHGRHPRHRQDTAGARAGRYRAPTPHHLAVRTRLSRDIHEGIAQGFSSILLLAWTALIEGDPQRVREILRRVESGAARGLEESRRVVGALAPTDLDDGSLTGAVRRVADRLAAETGVAARVAVSAPLPPVSTTFEVAPARDDGLLR